MPQVGHVEFSTDAERAQRIGARSGIGTVLPALIAPRRIFRGVVSGREAERQVTHDLTGTHRGNRRCDQRSRSQLNQPGQVRLVYAA
ncbi:Uncharacterised protein [Mycobacterium tuberculosis]|uniref:Uncharacterized protein n=1 Tax=Mycobacterium tuberculosis TaxID=1773 RepID=A0A0U0QWJ1_MYCTX|nr:Uncharacterised protein [Mycobacterium tuberculosis]COV51114.1 Uncharacterised protein [Mycobacterium tuberculosis]COV69204.1 Uncharacterised protein [Mycobacterium tuberculosis]COW50917.1 Uncharacterised protein [Mycobacterium tuberculosis]COW63734.1 Uncharacterised protein [Mycobacterium tuberculosis]